MSEFLGTMLSWLVERWPILIGGTGSAVAFLVALYEKILKIKEAQRNLADRKPRTKDPEPVVQTPTPEEISKYGYPTPKTRV